ncbi:ComF family protein [Streptomyces antnestii]|uniref:ComF family protein n=1 Tax=Streptomyces antnestii TaxID=2494256 RepID=A0A437PQM8_9ACTN|nr:ComF family protein [Streptomyces sp. San01]RVU24550.1 ComF family protein [Streptomyces sp. San01]
MRGWWQGLGDLVLPAECGGCGRPRTALCARCGDALCGGVPGRVRPSPEPAGLPVVHAAAPYRDAVRAVLLAHKERGALGLAEPLGVALAGAVCAGMVYAGLGGVAGFTGPTGPGGVAGFTGPAGRGSVAGLADPTGPGGVVGLAGPIGPTGSTGLAGMGGPAQAPARAEARTHRRRAPLLLVPVPSARKAVRARGHDPARRIAYAAAAELRRAGVPTRVLAALRQRRPVEDQAGLNSRRRLANLAGALEVPAGAHRLLAQNGRIVLVDDLMTTGASLAEAARAIRAARPRTGEDEGGRSTPGWMETARELPPRNLIIAAVVAASPGSFEINRN